MLQFLTEDCWSRVSSGWLSYQRSHTCKLVAENHFQVQTNLYITFFIITRFWIQHECKNVCIMYMFVWIWNGYLTSKNSASAPLRTYSVVTEHLFYTSFMECDMREWKWTYETPVQQMYCSVFLWSLFWQKYQLIFCPETYYTKLTEYFRNNLSDFS